ncbi:hypothetical protein M3P19_09355 [Muricauda sp. 2012CJ35-5]|uniref:Alpha/beta hydrolase n=1 Tax=Flagellimonas spongiicola TaxID=2942208 RepID=A0ABT0PSH1_9FLAO|nr:hypothetical protein [Allomuricauda spongiicola]MCL6274216.1 hypothetical protein [Allomuricauda spongiicola]
MRSFLWVLCIFVLPMQGQNQLEIGKVIDSIPVKDSPNEYFALYLPTTYSTEKSSSIIFVFEPAARGAIGVGPFISSAEKYGHIVVCSNNSRNAPYDRNFAIANNLFGHVFANFSIIDGEIYAAGLSGGSRLAAAVASITDKFAGVVGCGAGFSGLNEHQPSAQGYAYVGLCGDRDMNYREMVENKSYLNLIKYNNTLITFDGEHRWPPETQMLRAFDWLHLQKLKTQSPLPKEELLKAYQRDYELLSQFRTNKQLLYEAEQLERIIKDYKGMFQLDSLSQQYKALVKSKPLKLKLEALDNALEQERKWVSKFDTQLLKDLANPEKTNWNWWKKELEKLDKSKGKDERELKKMIYRIRFDLFVRVFSRKNALIHDQSDAQSNWIDTLLDLLNPS